MAKEDEDGVWRTVSGRRIFISNGESLIEAMKKSGKFKKKMHGPNDPKIKKANKPYEKEDAKRAKQYERDQELRKTIQNKKELRRRLEQMKKSGKFKDILGEPRDTEKEAFKKKYSESFENWKKANPQATDDEIIGILKAKQYNGELGGNSIDALNKIDRLADEIQHYTNDFDLKKLEKKGREMGSKEFEDYANELRKDSWSKRNSYNKGDVIEYDSNYLGVTPRWNRGEILEVGRSLAGHGNTNPDNVYTVRDLKTEREYKVDAQGVGKRISKGNNSEIPNRFKDGFKIQNSKYSDENKMTLVEDGSGVRLIYDGKDTGTVLRNDLSDSEISSLRNAGKIQNMSEYLGEKYSLNDKQLRTLHNHLEANIKTWREQGMSNQQILDMVSDRQEIAGDDGLYNLKGIDMNSKKTEVLNEYQSYIQNKISTKTKKDYDAGLKKINKIPTDGTYDLETGSSKDYSDGYQVTFSMTDMDFDDKTYQDLVEKFKTHDHGTVDAGKYEGYPEISFNVTDLKTAAKLATKYNQISIWDWKNGKIIPTKGTGAYADYKPMTTQDISKSVARTRGLQNRILNYEDEIKTLKRKSSLTFTDKQKLMKLQREKEKLENQLK